MKKVKGEPVIRQRTWGNKKVWVVYIDGKKVASRQVKGYSRDKRKVAEDFRERKTLRKDAYVERYKNVQRTLTYGGKAEKGTDQYYYKITRPDGSYVMRFSNRISDYASAKDAKEDAKKRAYASLANEYGLGYDEEEGRRLTFENEDFETRGGVSKWRPRSHA